MMGLTVGLRLTVGPAGGVPGITLPQEHVTVIRRAAVALQPRDGLRHAVLALAVAQVSGALRHAADSAGPANPEVPSSGREPGKHGVAAPHGVGVVPHRGPTLLQQNRLVLCAEERRVVVLHEAAVELHRSPARPTTYIAGAGDGARHAGGAVRHGEVAAALVEAGHRVLLRGSHHREVVIRRVRGRVHQRCE